MFISATANAQDKIDLKVNFSKKQQCKISATYEHTGSVIVVPDDPKAELQQLPLSVEGKLSFYQRVTGAEQAIRYFENGEAKITLDKGKTNPKLAEDNRLIVARLKGKQGGNVELASIVGTLEQAELELIQNPADPLTLANILTKSGVKVGDKWDPKDADLAKLLDVHTINESDVQLFLKKADKATARVYIMGSVSAEVDDVETQLEVSGVAIVDLKKQWVNAFKIGIREQREPGQIAPGFNGKTKIDMQIMPGESSPNLSNASLAKFTKSRKIRQRLKWSPEVSHFLLTYDPHWKMIAAEGDAAILRYIDKRDLLTQCNIVQLPSRSPDAPLSLNSYKLEVGKIVKADKNARLVRANETKTETGLRALQVVVAGEEDELAVNWLYFHVSAKDGRQVTFVFTLAEEVAGKVKPIAEQLVNEFAFKAMPDRKAAAQRQSQKPATTSSRKR